MMDFITGKKGASLIGTLFLLAIWHLVAKQAGSEQLFPTPWQTLSAVGDVIVRDGFLSSLSLTVLRGLEGFAISIFLAFLIGIPAGLSPWVFGFINPFLVAIRSTPVISFILLAIIWLGTNQVPVFIALLTMFPVLCTNIIDGIRHVNHDLVEMAEVFKVKKLLIIRDIHIPGILPFLTSGISNAMGFGWRAIIIGEVLSQPEWGIGTEMQKAQIYLRVSELIAWTLIAIVVSYLFEMLVRNTEKNLFKWKKA